MTKKKSGPPRPHLPGNGGGSSGSSGSSSSGSSSTHSSGSGPFGYSQFQYNQMARAYQNVASHYIGQVSAAMIHNWIGHGVSVSEVNQRFMVLQRIRENQQWFQSFNNVLHIRGILKPNQNFNFEMQKNFVLGNLSPKFYNVWGEAANQAGLRQQGIAITGNNRPGGNLSLTTGQAKSLENRLGRDAAISGAANKTYAQVADILSKLPDAALTGLGFSKQDALTVAAGGQDAARIKQQWQQIEANAAAFSTTQAQDVASPLDQSQQQGQSQGYTPGSQ